EQLLTISPPPRPISSLAGYLRLEAPNGKTLYVHLVPARFIRGIRNPLSVGRELPSPLAKWRRQEWDGIAIARHGQKPKIKLHLQGQIIRVHQVQQELAIRRPVLRPQRVMRFDQAFFGAIAIRASSKQIRGSA